MAAPTKLLIATAPIAPIALAAIPAVRATLVRFCPIPFSPLLALSVSALTLIITSFAML